MSETEKKSNDREVMPYPPRKPVVREGYVIVIDGINARYFLDMLKERYKRKNMHMVLVPYKHSHPRKPSPEA